jgi:hypothetical protein
MESSVAMFRAKEKIAKKYNAKTRKKVARKYYAMLSKLHDARDVKIDDLTVENLEAKKVEIKRLKKIIEKLVSFQMTMNILCTDLELDSLEGSGIEIKIDAERVEIFMGMLNQKVLEELRKEHRKEFILYREAEKQEALLRLRAILPSEKAFKEAIAWKEKSLWNLKAMYKFIIATGKIPPDEVKKFPIETLIALEHDSQLFLGKRNFEINKK